MTQTFRYGGIDLGNKVIRLGKEPGFEEVAEKGTYGSGGIPIDDPTGSLSLNGWKTFVVTEDACSDPRLFTGYAADRTIARGDDSLILGAARRWDTTILDLNAIFSLRLLLSAASYRPIESDVTRITWLLGNGWTPDLHDNGLFDKSNPITLDKADYRGRYAYDVLADAANYTGNNFFAYWDNTAAQASLFYGLPSSTAYSSTLRLTNIAADVDGTITFAAHDINLTTDPSRIYSGVYVPFNGSQVFRTDPTTQANFIQREVSAPMPSIGKTLTAIHYANKLLVDASSEDQRIKCTVDLPASKVNLIRAGHRIQVKFTHIPGYSSAYTYVRVVRRSVSQEETTPDIYRLTLELANPKMTGFAIGGTPNNVPNNGGNTVPFQGACDTIAYVQGKVGAYTGSAVPTPSTVTLDVAPTAGSLLVAQITTSNLGQAHSDPIAGWNRITGLGSYELGPGDTRTVFMEFWYKVSDGSETTLNIQVRNSVDVGIPARINYAEYSGFSAAILDVNAANACAAAAPGTPCTIPAVTPSGPGLILFLHQHDDDGYALTGLTGTYTQRLSGYDASNLTRYVIHDQIVTTVAGTYSGSISDTGLSGPSFDLAQIVFSANCSIPATGQPTTGGSSVTTTYPYAPGSLKVLVDGIRQTVIESDPTTGAYTLSWSPSSSDKVVIEYQGA